MKPDILAPGNDIVSALASNSRLAQLYPSNIVPVSYYKNGGTSYRQPIFPTERDKHGCAHGKRGSRSALAKGPFAHARSSEGAAYENSKQAIPIDQLMAGSRRRHVTRVCMTSSPWERDIWMLTLP